MKTYIIPKQTQHLSIICGMELLLNQTSHLPRVDDAYYCWMNCVQVFELYGISFTTGTGWVCIWILSKTKLFFWHFMSHDRFYFEEMMLHSHLKWLTFCKHHFQMFIFEIEFGCLGVLETSHYPTNINHVPWHRMMWLGLNEISNTFCKERLVFWLKCHWSLFQRVQMTCQHWFS